MCVPLKSMLTENQDGFPFRPMENIYIESDLKGKWYSFRWSVCPNQLLINIRHLDSRSSNKFHNIFLKIP